MRRVFLAICLLVLCCVQCSEKCPLEPCRHEGRAVYDPVRRGQATQAGPLVVLVQDVKLEHRGAILARADAKSATSRAT